MGAQTENTNPIVEAQERLLNTSDVLSNFGPDGGVGASDWFGGAGGGAEIREYSGCKKKKEHANFPTVS